MLFDKKLVLATVTPHLVDRVVMPLFKEGTFDRFKVQGKWKNIREYVHRIEE